MFLFSCKVEKTLPSSTGSSSEIVVVKSDGDIGDEYKKILNRIFCSEIAGVGIPEKKYKLLFIGKMNFKSILKTHKNIILLSNNNDYAYAVEKDKWANNQIICQIPLNSDTTVFRKNSDLTLKKIRENEINNLKKDIKKNHSQRITESVINRFNLKLFMPHEFSLIMDSIGFVWAGYNPSKKDEIVQILISELKNSTSTNSKELLSQANLLMQTYLKGEKANQKASIDYRLTPILSDGYYRGLWRLEGGFMGGVFLAKEIRNEENKNILALAVIFSPQKPKRSFINKIEAIFN